MQRANAIGGSHLVCRPCTLKQANDLVAQLHRHHRPEVGHRFSISAWCGGDLVGAAICGRPKARALNQSLVLEVTRLVTNGHKNAPSFLYARCARTAEAMGFVKIVTYILETEPGTTLIAAGWKRDGVIRRNGVGWNSRQGRQSDNQGPKVRWSKDLSAMLPWEVEK